MRTLNKPVIFLLFSLISLTLKSQCYINLGDYSGAKPQSPSFFEADACDLRSVFPDITKFAVYDFGFYTETEPMAGSEGYESFLTVAKSQIQHDYYLLFARVNTPSGLNQRIIVEFKFPFEETAFDCLNEDDIGCFRIYLQAFANEQLKKSNEIDLAIKNTIIKYTEYIKEKKECCLIGVSSQCSPYLSEEELSTSLKANDFYIIKVDEFICCSQNCVKYKIGSTSYDFFGIANEYKNQFSPYFSKIEVKYQIVSLSDIFSNYSFLETKEEQETFFGWKIIVLESKKEIWVKSYIGGKPKSGPGTIHIINDNSNTINIDEYVSRLKHFFKLITCIIPPITSKSTGITLPEISNNDIFVYIGTPKFVKTNLTFCPVASLPFKIAVYLKLGPGTNENPGAIEMGDGFIAPTGRTVVIDWNAMGDSTFPSLSKEDLAAFVTIHALGHCVKGGHLEPHNPGAYLSSGPRLRGLAGSNNDNQFWTNKYFTSLDDYFSREKYILTQSGHEKTDMEDLEELNVSICALLGY